MRTGVPFFPEKGQENIRKVMHQDGTAYPF
jgi:hypothetical protein